MKVQYQLVDVGTKRVIAVGDEFELVDFAKTYFDQGEPWSWGEAAVICGDPLSIEHPMGILDISPIKTQRKAVL